VRVLLVRRLQFLDHGAQRRSLQRESYSRSLGKKRITGAIEPVAQDSVVDFALLRPNFRLSKHPSCAQLVLKKKAKKKLL
jgi:hypothetical protein